MTFDEAQRFGESIKTTYRDLGYDLVELPCDSPERRAEIILARIRVDSTERQ